MDLWACPEDVALVVVVVDVDVLVDVDVDVDVDVLLLDPQPTSATISATVMVAAVKCFINQLSRKLGPAPAPAARIETSRSRCRKLLDHLVRGQPPHHRPSDEYRQPAGEHPIQQNRRHT